MIICKIRVIFKLSILKLTTQLSTLKLTASLNSVEFDIDDEKEKVNVYIYLNNA